MFAGKLTAIFGCTALNLVHAKSIPNDLRSEQIPPGGIKFLFSSLSRPALVKTQKRVFGSAVLRFRRQVLIERLWNEYALEGENYRQSCWKNFRSGMREMGCVRVGLGLTRKRGGRSWGREWGRWVAGDMSVFRE
jgi:hypothetical protein